MNDVVARLIEEAKRVLRNSYAPYSGVHVAAALLASSGRIYLGVNVENASYGLTICAERAAVAAAVTAGERSFKAIAVVSDTEEPLPPCGACRQVLAEFAGDDMIVVSHSVKTGRTRVWRLGDLLPHAFRPSHLGRSGGQQRS